MSFEIHTVRGEEGSPLRAVVSIEGTDRYDPFLVLHERGPVTYRPGRAVGFTDHPHRGFETVNYIIEGEQFHRDPHFEALVLSAMPIGEPVLSEGPFVMTTPEEIREAFADYRSGRFAATAAAR